MESMSVGWEQDVRPCDGPFIAGVCETTCFAVRDDVKVDSCQPSYLSVVVTA